MALQQKIPVQPQPAIASYDFQDFFSGLGYKTFYLIKSIDGDRLIDFTESSHGTSTGGSVEEVAASASEDHNYDTSTFNLPRVIDGVVYVAFVTKKDHGSSSSHVVTLYHVDSSDNETSLATDTFTYTSDQTIQYVLMELSVTNQRFGIGEKLRLSIDTTNGAGGALIYGTDPDGRAGSGTTITLAAGETISKVHVPFKIDIS